MAESYAGAGVDVEAGRRAVDLIRRSVASTARPEVVGGLGGFGGLFAFDPARYRQPLLVSSTDGVGTKVLIAQALGRHDTIGIDLVAMSVDDVVAQGAEPLFFLDYLLIERLVPGLVDEIVSGIAAGCRTAGENLCGGAAEFCTRVPTSPVRGAAASAPSSRRGCPAAARSCGCAARPSPAPAPRP